MIWGNMGGRVNHIGKRVHKGVGNETIRNPNNFFMIYNQKKATNIDKERC